MARRNITQRSMAARLGMTQQALSRRLSGEVRFDVEELGQIADMLGIPVALLFGEAA
jgi:transcriptional regulator with XRE-family HTH domain